MDKTIIDKSTAAAAPPCSKDELQTPQFSGVMLISSQTKTPASTSMNIVDSGTRPNNRFETATPLAGHFGVTGKGLVEASIVRE